MCCGEPQVERERQEAEARAARADALRQEMVAANAAQLRLKVLPALLLQPSCGKQGCELVASSVSDPLCRAG